MKKITITLLLFFGLVSMAQNNRVSLPDGFSYKALLVENGNPVANSIITVKVTFKENSTTRWVETHSNVHTDANGIFSIYIGEGTRVSGSVSHFNSLDWHVSNMNLTVEVDSGSGYVPLVSGEKLAYMPFAKYANKAYSATTATTATDAAHATNADNADNADNATNASHLNPQTDSEIQLITTDGNFWHGYRLTKGTEDWYLYMNSSNDFVIRNDSHDVFKILNASNNIWIDGDVRFEKSITAEDSGNADMKAYIYGRVNTDGSIITNASSDGFTCTRVNTGQYRISFTNSPGSLDNYIVIATASSSSMNVGVSQINDYFTLYVRDTSSNSYTNALVSFVVYKK
jgi:hypothetical protein